MAFALDRDSTLTEIAVAPITLDDIQYPASIFTLWSDEERAALGIYPVVDDPIPEGKIATGSTLERDGDVVRRHWTLEDAPQPPRLRKIAPLAFRKRFGPALPAITLAAAQALAAGDPTLQVFLDNLSSARFVDLDDPDTQAGVAAVLAAGLITQEQAEAALVDGTPEETEGLAV